MDLLGRGPLPSASSHSRFPTVPATGCPRDGDIFCIVPPKVGAYSIVFVVLLMLTLLALVWT